MVAVRAAASRLCVACGLLAAAASCGTLLGIGDSTLDPLLDGGVGGAIDANSALGDVASDALKDSPDVATFPADNFVPDAAYAGDSAGPADASGSIGDATAILDGSFHDTAVPMDGNSTTALISPSGVDFGIVPCGGAPPADRTVSITNVGAGPMPWQAALRPTPYFALAGPTGGTIDPGGVATVRVTAQAIPPFAVAGSTVQSTLTITTSDATAKKTDLTVVATAGGAAFSLVPATAAFGRVPVGVQATDIPVALVNTGNLAATVNLAQPANSQFDVVWTGSPGPVVLQPTDSVPGLAVRFRPSSTAASFSSTAITATGTICGVSPSTITMTGQGTSGSAIVQPAALDFGLVSCGAQAPSKEIAIQNTGGTSFDWTTSFARGSSYSLSMPNGTIPAGGSTTVRVTPAPIPATSATTPDLYADTLTISTTAPGDAPHVVSLHETASGAILSNSATAIGFGGVAVGTTATQQFTVSNNGNASATVSFAASSPFRVGPQGQVVGVSAFYPATIGFSPTSGMPYASAATMSVSPATVLCSPLPPAIGVSGTGTTSAVSVGPADLDFGLVNCGSQGTPRTVTIQNTGATSYNWTATLTAGASYYSLDSGSGALVGGASMLVTITPAPIPATSSVTPDLYAGTLTITTDLPGDVAHSVSLHETANGAILSWNPSSLASGISFGTVPVGSTAASPWALTNSGNASADLTLAVTDTQNFASSPAASTTTGGATLNGSAVFAPQSSGSFSANMSVVTTAVLCAPLPPFIPLTGDGQ